MDDFLQSLKASLENRPEAEFRESAWKAMQAKLRAEESGGTRRLWPFWWIYLLAALLGGSLFLNVYWFAGLHPLNPEGAPVRFIHRIDTVLQTKIIYSTDTLVETRIERQYLIRRMPPVLNSGDYESIFGKILPPVLDTAFRRPKLVSYSAKSLFARNYFATKSPQDAVANPPEKKIHRFDRSDLHELDHRYGRLLFSTLLPTTVVETIKKKQTLGQMIYPMRPKNLVLGLQGGLFLPLEKNVKNRSGFMYGLDAELAFSERLHLFTGFHYLAYQYQVNRIDQLADLPPIDPPGGHFVFQNAQIMQPGLIYTAGLKYLWGSGKKLRPYLGLGLAATTLLPLEVSYDYEDVQQGVDINLDKKLTGQGSTGNQWILKLGLDYRLNEQWNGQVHAYYRNSWKTEGFISPDIIGLRAGLSFRLKK